jgi:SAM-dependent methyltransferase
MATRLRLRTPSRQPPPVSEAARAYDLVGEDYRNYADGRNAALFDFSGAYAYADREIWSRLEAELVRLRTAGRHAIRILDAGCGPGTWLLRLAARARDLGFTAIDGRGFDISGEMIALADKAKAAVDDPHIGIRFDVADIANALDDEDDGSYDLVLCLYGVLNHLPHDARISAAAALTRVAEGDIFVSVRTVGSTPSIFVSALEQARDFHQDNERDRLEVDLADGRHIGFSSHLFTAAELQALFSARLQTSEIVGLDLFHGRFALDPRWNPNDLRQDAIAESLVRLEHLCAHDPAFLDRAAHVLLHARSLPANARPGSDIIQPPLSSGTDR